MLADPSGEAEYFHVLARIGLSSTRLAGSCIGSDEDL